MVKRKTKPLKRGRKRALKEDVHATTSLPPSVDGQLRCFLRVSVSKIVWQTAKPPDTTHVRLRWWGETAEGSVFRPLDVKNPQRVATRTVARYPVRCGPKQFAAYLSDMGMLALEVLKGPGMSSIGKAQINEIGHLAPQVPINGFYSVFSNKSADKIAELHASLVFEPLPAAYDSSSSIPTTDLSVATAGTGTTAESGSVRSGPPLPAPRPRKVVSSSSEDPFMSPIPKVPHHQRHPDPLKTVTPRGVDEDYSFVVGPGKTNEPDRENYHITSGAETRLPTAVSASDETTKGPSSDTDRARTSEVETLTGTNRETAWMGSTEPAARRQRRPDGSGRDLIAALLDRGTQLRDDMIRSELDGGPPAAGRGPRGRPGTLRGDAPAGGADEAGEYPRPAVRRRSSGELFREILRTDDTPNPVDVSPALAQNGFEPSIGDSQTIELLIGEQISTRELNDLKTLQSELSPQSSISSESEVVSETEDPLRDQSILEELFYKGMRSSSSSSVSSQSDLLSSGDDEVDTQTRRPPEHRRRRRRRWSYESSLSDPGNQRPPSRKDKQRPSPNNAPAKDHNSRPPSDHYSRPPSDHGPSQIDGASLDARPRERNGSTSEVADSESDTGSTSRVSFQEPLEEKDVNPAGGLSVQRLTLLGGIQIARVMVDSLSLRAPPGTGTPDRRPSRGGRGRDRPPRPSAKPKPKKRTYFVEYRFPVTASPRERSLINTMATEVMRLASKRVDSTGEITFAHQSVFPVRFDGAAVDTWWRQLLVFKIFSRTAGQKSPVLLGVASLPLRSVLLSPGLALPGVELDARDKGGSVDPRSGDGADESSAGGRDEDTVVGTLKMSIELASDSKDFPAALARMKLAEMSGAKICPLPSHRPPRPVRVPTGSLDSDGKSSSRSAQTESTPAQVAESSSGDKDDPRPSAGQSTGGGKTSTGNSWRQVQREEKRLKEQPHRQMADEAIEVTSREDDASTKTQTHYEARTLHSLLLIPGGRAVTTHGVPPPKPSGHMPRTPPRPHPGLGVGISGLGGRDQTTRNTYLVCRLFWSDDSVRSNVCWGTTEPDYSFMQVSPVLLTPSLLERARNNCMVIEVWDKKTTAQNDQLVGIAKLPLHQLYMSFRDDRIADTLLKSQYPVVAVDNYVNIVDPFTGIQYGQLKVLLALGSSQQISAVQRLKCNNDALDTRPRRPDHYLERGEVVARSTAEPDSAQDELVEHVFEVVVEGVRGLPQLEDAVWGEADCFVQYHFPSQSPAAGAPDAIGTVSVGPILAAHRTPTTLCMPDPTFHDVSRHRLRLPRGTPVQRELLTACAGVGGGAGGIPFEVWCRYYYPNIRDQVVAKTSLPLAKLCAMVTMQRRGEPSVQTYPLPLRLQHPDRDSLTKEQMAKLQDAGLLDVTVSYRHGTVQGGASVPRSREAGGVQVCLSVGVLRACGLKSAALSLAQHDSSLQYASEVGVNAYVKMEVSFLSKQDVRVTQTVARTFAPDFSHHVDFPCPLLLDDEDSEQLSLAEALESAEIKLEVWHQVPGFKSDPDANFVAVDSGSGNVTGTSVRRLFAPAADILLGTATVPLRALLSHRTGLQGWYPLSIPAPGWTQQPSAHRSGRRPAPDSPPASPGRGPERVGGGLELSVKFARQGDRDRVLDAGRRVGWSPDAELDGLEELWDDEDSTSGSYSADISVRVDAAWFPVHTALRPGQQAMDTGAKAYVRYKLYDKDSVCSKLCYLDVNAENYASADLKHSRHFRAALTQPLAWYLREEKLEIQVWVSHNRELSPTSTGHARPRQRDKLIGCAYVDMSALCDKRVKHRRISGLFPLFRPGASDLGRSCARVHLSLKHAPVGSHRQQEFSDEAEMPLGDGTRRICPSQPHRQGQPKDALGEEEEQEEEEGRSQRGEEEEEAEAAAARREMARPVLMGVAVERAMHLVSALSSNRLDDSLPSAYVTFQSAGGSPIHTPTVPNSAQPVWGFEQEVRVSAEVLDRQSFIFKVWHQTSMEPDPHSDRMLGFASVDLAPLLAGFRSLNGWYHVLDFGGRCRGQIKVSLTPCESVSPLKSSATPKTSPNTSAILAQGLPHVPLATLPSTTRPRPAGSSPPSPPKAAHPPPSGHYQEHLQNVRLFHADLHGRPPARQRDPATSGRGRDGGRGAETAPAVGLGESGQLPSSVSSSFLIQNLRRNLSELDRVYRGLQQRLAHGSHTRPDETRSGERAPSPRLPSRKTSSGSGQVPHPTGDPTDEPRTGDDSDEDVLENVGANLRREEAERISNDDSAIGEATSDGRNRRSETEGPASPQLESDWEDSVQFREDRDGSPQEEDVIVVPRPLNDISSANFSNAVRPDAVPGRRTHRGTERDRPGVPRTSYDADGDSEISEQLLNGSDDELRRSSEVPGAERELDSEPGWTDRFGTGIGGGWLAAETNGTTGLAGRGTGSESETAESEPEGDRDRDGTGHTRRDGDAVADGDTRHASTGSPSDSENHLQRPVTPSSRASSECRDDLEGVDADSGSDGAAGSRPRREFTANAEVTEDAGREGERASPRSVADADRDRVRDCQTADSSRGSELEIGGRTRFGSRDGPSDHETRERTGDGRGTGGNAESSDESEVITIDPRQAAAGTRTGLPGGAKLSTTAKSPPAQLPNFFLPARDLEASMRALRTATAAVLPRAQPRPAEDSDESTSRPTDAAKELTQRLASRHPSARSRAPGPAHHKLPTAEEARRIARIFASRFSET